MTIMEKFDATYDKIDQDRTAAVVILRFLDVSPSDIEIIKSNWPNARITINGTNVDVEI